MITRFHQDCCGFWDHLSFWIHKLNTKQLHDACNVNAWKTIRIIIQSDLLQLAKNWFVVLLFLLCNQDGWEVFQYQLCTCTSFYVAVFDSLDAFTNILYFRISLPMKLSVVHFGITVVELLLTGCFFRWYLICNFGVAMNIFWTLFRECLHESV